MRGKGGRRGGLGREGGGREMEGDWAEVGRWGSR